MPYGYVCAGPAFICCYLGIPLLLPGSPCLYVEADLGGAFLFLSYLGAIFLHTQVSQLGLAVGLHLEQNLNQNQQIQGTIFQENS